MNTATDDSVDDPDKHEQPTKSWTTTIPTIVSVIVMVVVVWIGGLALHVWTSFLFWERWGHFWGVVAFCVPPLPEFAASIACFKWHIWYYILAVALWAISSCAMSVVDKDNDVTFSRFRPALFTGWICLVGVLSVTFGHYAWEHSLGPTSQPAPDQAQVEDCAIAVVSCLRASAYGDASAQVRLVTAKKELKEMIQRQDKAFLDEVCPLVDQTLRCDHFFKQDFVAYLTEWQQNGGESKFTVSARTTKALDQLPNKVRAAQGTDFSALAEAEMANIKTINGSTSRLPENWLKLVDEGFDNAWANMGQTYLEVLGRPMPHFAD